MALMNHELAVLIPSEARAQILFNLDCYLRSDLRFIALIISGFIVLAFLSFVFRHIDYSISSLCCQAI